LVRKGKGRGSSVASSDKVRPNHTESSGMKLWRRIGDPRGKKEKKTRASMNTRKGKNRFKRKEKKKERGAILSLKKGHGTTTTDQSRILEPKKGKIHILTLFY